VVGDPAVRELDHGRVDVVLVLIACAIGPSISNDYFLTASPVTRDGVERHP